MDDASSSLQHSGALRVRGLGSPRHEELASSALSTIGSRRPGSWLRNDFRRFAGSARDVETPVMRRHEPENVRNNGRLSDPLGLLRSLDSFPAGSRMECDSGSNQLP